MAVLLLSVSSDYPLSGAGLGIWLWKGLGPASWWEVKDLNQGFFLLLAWIGFYGVLQAIRKSGIMGIGWYDLGGVRLRCQIWKN
jgi:hypothetical protein